MANTGTLRESELWRPASTLPREEPKFAPLPAPALKNFFPQGLPRGGITEINGGRSSGRSSVCVHILAQSTARGEICAIVDLNDSFHPASAAAAGVRLAQIVWIRCHGNAEHAMHAADLLLHAGGFGVVLLDLCEANARVLNRIPLSYWYRFRKAVEHTPAILLVCAASAQAKSCSLNSLKLFLKSYRWTGEIPFLLLRGLEALGLLRRISSIKPESLFFQTEA